MLNLVPDENGCIPLPTTLGTILLSPILPIDSSTLETWAHSLVERGLNVIKHGLGDTFTGDPYTLDDFMCDTLIGDVPWNTEQYDTMMQHMKAHPRYQEVVDAFKDKYNVCYFCN